MAANRVAAAIPRFGQSADVLAVLGERHGDASGPNGATCDLAAVLLGLPEEWRAAALTALGSELNSEAPKRILVAAESVTTQPWRAIGLATALTSLNATAVPRDAETDDAFRRLGQETAGVLSNPATWTGVDPQWREDALQSLAAAVDAPTKARILAAADPAEGAYYWKAVAVCGDTLNPTKALQHALAAATALRSKEPTDVPNPAAILAALAASYPREEWLPLLHSLDGYERAPLIAAAAPHVVAALGPDAYLRLTTSLHDFQRASLVVAAAPVWPVERLSELLDLARDADHVLNQAWAACAVATRCGAEPGAFATHQAAYDLISTALRALDPGGYYLEEPVAALLAAQSAASPSVAGPLVRIQLRRAADRAQHTAAATASRVVQTWPAADRLATLVDVVDYLAGSREFIRAEQRSRLARGLPSLLPLVASLGGSRALRALGVCLPVAAGGYAAKPPG